MGILCDRRKSHGLLLTPATARYPLTPATARYPLTPATARYPLTPATARYPLTPATARYPLVAIGLATGVVDKIKPPGKRVRFRRQALRCNLRTAGGAASHFAGNRRASRTGLSSYRLWS
ncbi:hypothetical protein RRG08_053167 [Elysia crispata]|uniref:Uncharacterized protein n=1 Tax=Elysia crispata TaxID=231223 RepID=A0AAE0YQL8_9GAST|nr:hypothetical protein RRG08_053167 [Elysia crispata]